MVQGISAAFVGAMLALTPGLAMAADGTASPGDSDPVTDAEAFSIVAGQILGAASACDQIDAGRVSVATDKAVGIASETADDANDVAAAKQLMIDAAEKGRDAVKNGDADCASVQTSFTKLEQIEHEGDQANQQEQLGQVPQGQPDQPAPPPSGDLNQESPDHSGPSGHSSAPQ